MPLKQEEVVRRGSKRAAAKPGTKERERMPKTRYKFDAAKEDVSTRISLEGERHIHSTAYTGFTAVSQRLLAYDTANRGLGHCESWLSPQ